ncbi:MAG: NifB/NifX family molybdenum-iron cluster-binding protein [FCB group bacterium]|jgi:predicted Fe-Mo cluster-binding NifX family protein|nr:NifB/NifX family molybdenum-iron cluster-binding protein [FCB group bacterium]
MRLAVAEWNGYVSPVFDTAGRVRIVETDSPAELEGHVAEITEEDAARRALRLVELRVDVLICGAISRPLEAMIAAQGIRVVPRVCGPASEVIQSFAISQTLPDEFAMPGCCRRGGGHGQRMRRRQGDGGGNRKRCPWPPS